MLKFLPTESRWEDNFLLKKGTTMETKIYLDNSATTKVSDEVLAEIMPFLKESYGNPSSIYSLGRKSAIALSNSRRSCAEILGAELGEIIFTSGGTEGNNFAVKSACEIGAASGKKHIITTPIEHHSVLEAVKRMERKGFSVSYLTVDREGRVDPEEVKRLIREDTALVSVMAVNNELGTIEPVSEIGEICRSKGVIFHSDCVQAVGNIPLNVKEMKVDILTLSGHKIHGLKGTGLIYISKSISLPPYMEGGKQELGKRAGTENVPGIVGLAKAMQLSREKLSEKNEKLSQYRKFLIEKISAIQDCTLNSGEHSVKNILNFSFKDIESESLILQLDLKGVAVSGGSACASGAFNPSHVLTAVGLSEEQAKGAIRISMSDYTTMEELKEFTEILPDIIAKLRKLRG